MSDDLEAAYFKQLRSASSKIDGFVRKATKQLQTRTPAILYHYTNAGGLLGILKESEFWATDIRFMNDATELSYAIDRFEQSYRPSGDKKLDAFILKARADCIETIRYALYAVSFSELGDDLSQWRAYASSTRGYSIGISFPQKPPRKTILQQSPNADTALLKIIYSEEIQKRLLDSLSATIVKSAGLLFQRYSAGELGKKSEYLEESLVTDLSSHIVIPIVDLLVRFKHPSFNAEKEWRFLRYVIDPDVDDGKGNLSYARDYRVGPLGLQPFVRVKLPNRNSPKLPISEIWQGPNNEPKLARDALGECLTAHRYSGITIHLSSVPVRF